MFERYTEKARRVVFFARYEASQFGSQYIETEHLLLALLREEGLLVHRLLKGQAEIESIREQIEKQTSRCEKTSTSVDLPLSQESKRALAYAAEDATGLNHKHIAPVHLLLGLLREEQCVASKILTEYGVTSAQLKQEATLTLSASDAPVAGPTLASRLSASPEGPRDLTAAARNGALSPLIGRERELERTIQILARRTKNNPVLIGETGVGKNAIVHGLAQRIADGAVPALLEERPIMAIHASSLLSLGHAKMLSEIANQGNAILYVHGLFDLAGRGAGWGVREVIHVLERDLSHSRLQSIATGTLSGLRLALERAEPLTRHFEVVAVLPPSEDEAIRILSGVKEQYEKFHGVVVTAEAIEAAVSASRRFLRHRCLPDRAIDLIDEAGARVRLRRDHEPSASNLVDAEDIVEAVAARAGVPVDAVKSVLQVKEPEQLELIAKELAAQIPIGGGEWVEGLAAWLAGCPTEEAEKLAQAIRAAKARIDSQ